MERRFSIHAGAGDQALSYRGALRAWMLALVVVSIAGAAATADASPKRRDAKAEFNRGVAAYQKGDFEEASEALGKSFALERDVETLFAWAQTERKLEHCDKAIGLYEKLLSFKLAAANKEAVEQKLAECRAIVGQQKPPGGEPPPGTPPGDSKTTPADPNPALQPPVADRALSVTASPQTDTLGTRAWYKDPISIGLVGTGAVATGVGVGFLLSARSADSKINDKMAAPTYGDAEPFADKAKSRSKIGLVATGVGGAFLVGGVVWIVTHRHTAERPAITGWLAPEGGGLALTGPF